MAAPDLKPVETPAAWHGADLAKRAHEWSAALTRPQIDELYGLAGKLRERGGDLLDLTRADAALPVLGPRLAEMRRELLHGPARCTLEHHDEIRGRPELCQEALETHGDVGLLGQHGLTRGDKGDVGHAHRGQGGENNGANQHAPRAPGDAGGSFLH